MDWKEWATAAKYDGFEKIEARQVWNGWNLVGTTNQGHQKQLNTARGELRVFSSLDTVARYLSDRNVSSFEVAQVTANDLFG